MVDWQTVIFEPFADQKAMNSDANDLEQRDIEFFLLQIHILHPQSCISYFNYKEIALPVYISIILKFYCFGLSSQNRYINTNR